MSRLRDDIIEVMAKRRRDESSRTAVPSAEALGAAYGLSPYPPVPQGEASRATRPWLITIVDLTTLLLTFFVLLFSMSHVEPKRYQVLAQSYGETFAPFPTQTPVHRLAKIAPASGDDLEYLQAVLKSAFMTSPTLRDIEFRLTPQYLMLTLPVTALFMADSGNFSESARTPVFDLSGVLSNLQNRIAVVGTAAIGASGDKAAAWQLSMLRAAAMADALAKAGYGQPVTVLGSGGAATDVGAAIGRIQIMIMPEKAAS